MSSPGRLARWGWVALPFILVAALVTAFLRLGSPGLPRQGPPPAERLVLQRVQLQPGLIRVRYFNDGPAPARVAQVLVNEAYWTFRPLAGGPIPRLGSGELVIPYPWTRGDPLLVSLVTESGLVFSREIQIAAPSPRPGAGYLASLGLLGVYIGVIPVLLGMLWLPALRRLKSISFFLALTLGLLLFLGVDSFKEALEAAAHTPGSLLATGLLTLGFALAFLLIFALNRRGERAGGAAGAGVETDQAADQAAGDRRRLRLAFALAFGIGVHNLGEGLAVGAAHAVGNLALGTLLVVGFMVHNVTEGLAIVAPLSRARLRGAALLARLLLLGVLAGAPAVLGAWLGGFAYSPATAVFFLAVGAGAIFQVFVEILAQMGRGKAASLLTVRNTLGFLLGVAVMYGTGLLVAG